MIRLQENEIAYYTDSLFLRVEIDEDNDVLFSIYDKLIMECMHIQVIDEYVEEQNITKQEFLKHTLTKYVSNYFDKQKNDFMLEIQKV